jgi:hypothetical protein
MGEKNRPFPFDILVKIQFTGRGHGIEIGSHIADARHSKIGFGIHIKNAF